MTILSKETNILPIGVRGVGYKDMVRLLEGRVLTPNPNQETTQKRGDHYLYFYPYTQNWEINGLAIPAEHEGRILKGDPDPLAKKWAKADSEQGEGFLLKLHPNSINDFKIEPDAWFGKRHFYAFQVACPQGIGINYFTEIVPVGAEDERLFDILTKDHHINKR